MLSTLCGQWRKPRRRPPPSTGGPEAQDSSRHVEELSDFVLWKDQHQKQKQSRGWTWSFTFHRPSFESTLPDRGANVRTASDEEPGVGAVFSRSTDFPAKATRTIKHVPLLCHTCAVKLHRYPPSEPAGRILISAATATVKPKLSFSKRDRRAKNERLWDVLLAASGWRWVPWPVLMGKGEGGCGR